MSRPRITDHGSRITLFGLWTIVPVHGIAAGKSRLAAVLGPAARAALNRRLLGHTLSTVAAGFDGLERCIVVSPCGAALALARGAGALVLREPRGAGLNRALARAAALAARRGARKLLVLPCDLPRLGTRALAALARAGRGPRAMAIAPDRAGTGTNALLAGAQRPHEFRFGAGSFARHLSLAAERGWSVAVCARPELGFDLDTPEDLEESLRKLPRRDSLTRRTIGTVRR